MRRPPSPGLARAFLALAAVTLSIAAPALGRCAAAGACAAAEPAAADSATFGSTVSSPGPAAVSDLVAGGVPHSTPAPRVYFGSARHLRVVPPRVSVAPSIDGLLNDEAWAQAAVLDSFTQGRPIEAVPDSLGTRCYVMYDERNLYVGFRCPDDPRGVQSPVTPRDESWRGDFACVNIDAYHDHQRSQFFCVNPQGVQMDGMDAEGVDSDLAPDFLYTAHARRVQRGWDVEMAIPFTSLRFSPHDSVSFGFNASRQIKRENSEVFWAPVTKNINSYHAQMGALAGMSGVSPGRNLQVNPTLTGTRLGERSGPGLGYQDDHRFGLGLKYGVTSGLTADLAVTPDFSQVEADAGVVDANERFAIYYPEKRPFFLEGSDFFRSPINLVYTRRIVDPRVGAKLTGKVGRNALGVITASDRFDGESIDGLTNDRNPYFDHDARYGIVRLQRDVLDNSYVGLLGGTREQLETYSRGLGVDGRLSILRRYTLSFQRVQSWARDRDFRRALTAADSIAFGGDIPETLSGTGRLRTGDASWLELRSNAKHLDVSGSVLDITPDFSADMGFVNRTNQITGLAVVAPHVISSGDTWWTRVEPNFRFERTYDHGATRRVGQRTDESLQQQVELVFPRNSWVGAGYRRLFTAFQGQRFDGQDRFQIWFGSERWESVRGGLFVGGGENVLFDEAVPGRFVYLEGWSDLRLTDQLDASINLVAERDRRRDGTRFVDQVIPRVRVSYQFTRELALRHIVELQSERRFDAAGWASHESRSLSLDWLASYVLRPGTVAYLGYGALLTGPSAHGLRTERNSVFAKVSYLWQG